MKRIEMITKGVSATVKAFYKEKRIIKALEIATMNANEALDEANATLEELPTSVDDLTPDEIITKIAESIAKVEDAEYTLDVLKKVGLYLNENVKEK